MKKYMTDEKNGLDYTLVNGVFFAKSGLNRNAL